MNLPKAIEILSDSAYRGITAFDQDFRDAEKLGIEAMKEVNVLRKVLTGLGKSLLPGETED